MENENDYYFHQFGIEQIEKVKKCKSKFNIFLRF